MDDATADSVPVERRKAARVRTLRHAFFAALSGVGRLQEGTITDISCRGLGIRTRRPTTEGDRIDIEMHGKDVPSDDTTMMLRGRVARVEDLGEGEYAMGVHLAAKSPARHAMHATPVRAGVRAGVRAVSPSSPAAFRRQRQPSSPGTRSTQRGESGASRRAAYATLALMLLVFLLLCWQTVQRVHGETSAHPGARVASFQEADINGDSNPLLRRVQHTPPSTRANHDNKGLLSPFMGPDRLMVEPSAATAPVASSVDDLDGEPEASDVLVATLAPALDAVGGDEPVLAIVVTDLVLGMNGGSEPLVPRTQPSSPLTHASHDNKGVLPPYIPHGFVGTGVGGAGSLASGRTLYHRPEAETYPVFVLVETSRFALTIFVDGAPARQFPVGLGKDGATPKGLFRIGTKLSDPDWYNRGEVVPAGDPGNPIGRRWMGLNGRGRPTSYGIHPTRDASSIGRPRSRGCVRMRPQDAETLFRICPVGTPVRICE